MTVTKCLGEIVSFKCLVNIIKKFINYYYQDLEIGNKVRWLLWNHMINTI